MCLWKCDALTVISQWKHHPSVAILRRITSHFERGLCNGLSHLSTHPHASPGCALSSKLLNAFMQQSFSKVRPTFWIACPLNCGLFERILLCWAHFSGRDTHDNSSVKTWRWSTLKALGDGSLLRLSCDITPFKSTHLLSSLQLSRAARGRGITNEHIISFRQAKWHKPGRKQTLEHLRGISLSVLPVLWHSHNRFIKHHFRMGR